MGNVATRRETAHFGKTNWSGSDAYDCTHLAPIPGDPCLKNTANLDVPASDGGVVPMTVSDTLKPEVAPG